MCDYFITLLMLKVHIKNSDSAMDWYGSLLGKSPGFGQEPENLLGVRINQRHTGLHRDRSSALSYLISLVG